MVQPESKAYEALSYKHSFQLWFGHFQGKGGGEGGGSGGSAKIESRATFFPLGLPLGNNEIFL